MSLGIYAAPVIIGELNAMDDKAEMLSIVEGVVGKKFGTPEAAQAWWKENRRRLAFLENPQ